MKTLYERTRTLVQVGAFLKVYGPIHPCLKLSAAKRTACSDTTRRLAIKPRANSNAVARRRATPTKANNEDDSCWFCQGLWMENLSSGKVKVSEFMSSFFRVTAGSIAITRVCPQAR